MKQFRFFPFFLALLTIVLPASAQRSVQREGVRFTLRSIKVLDDTLFFEFRVSNRSLLNYHLHHLRCYTQDRHVPRRTAVQQTDQEPLDPLQLQTVSANSMITFIILYPAFSLPDSKDLFVQIAESGHTRALRLRLRGRRFRRMLRKF